MSKKGRVSAIDFHFGIGAIVPSTQEAYHKEFKTNKFLEARMLTR